MIKKPLKEHIQEMKNIAEILISCTYPKAELNIEHDVLVLKQRSFIIDGYEVLACFSISDYEEYNLESLQIQAIYEAFLPFNVVCKIAQLFLGNKNLSYIEFFKNNKKIYCWTIKTKNGKVLTVDDQTKPTNYEGFKFNLLQHGTIDLF